MFRLTALLVAGIFLVLLIGGRDFGQQRLGLAGAYAPLVPPGKAARAAEPETLALASAEPVRRAPAPDPAPVARAAFTPAAAEPAQPGLTLALPLVEEPAIGGVQTGDGLFSAQTDGPATAAAPEVHYVVGNEVNVRETPSTKAAVLDQLMRGEAVTVLPSDTPGWSLVRIEGDGVEGYVASRFLSDARSGT